MASRLRLPRLAKVAGGGLVVFALFFAAACADEENGNGIGFTDDDVTTPGAPNSTPDPLTPAPGGDNGTPTPTPTPTPQASTIPAIGPNGEVLYVLLTGPQKGTPLAA